MEKEPVMRLLWRGHETIASVAKSLDEAERIEILLPDDFNHALFSLLTPDAANARLENIDVSGDTALLAKMATVNGLEELAALVELLAGREATVHLISPPRLIVTLG